ncbi:MAG TPA: hypothetical protein VK708_07625 [Bryobacteraceae bacterium]|nr:hypothetical protein [Bryobacteraceae bacterium]
MPILYKEGFFMGSVPSTNNGLSDLLQTLTNENSPLLSTLSSPNVQAALENAPASDIVQISDEAMQLQTTDALFGISNTSSSSSDSLFSALAAGSSPTSSASLADQLAAYQGNMQTQETQALFGITPPATTPSSSFDVFA